MHVLLSKFQLLDDQCEMCAFRIDAFLSDSITCCSCCSVLVRTNLKLKCKSQCESCTKCQPCEWDASTFDEWLHLFHAWQIKCAFNHKPSQRWTWNEWNGFSLRFLRYMQPYQFINGPSSFVRLYNWRWIR